MNELLLFTSSFITVLLLVVQSINNNHGRALVSFFTSFGIGIAQLTFYKLMPDANITEIVAFICGGPFGNIAAQYLKRRDIDKIRRLK